MNFARASILAPRLLVAFLLVALTLCVFVQVRHHDFVDYDDNAYILENPLAARPLSFDSVWQALTTTHRGDWLPLTWISHQIDFELYGLHPAGFLLTNVALHAASALLLLFALTRMTGSLWPSAFVAATFAVHPLHVESVAWAVERKDALSGLFWMLTLVAYSRYVERRGSFRYGVVVLCLVLGLLAKPAAITLPFVLLLLDYWPLRRLGDSEGSRLIDPGRLGRALWEKLPLLALAAAVSAITLVTHRAMGFTAFGDQLPMVLKTINALYSSLVYIAKSFWPTGLGLFYPFPLDDLSLWDGLAALVVLIAVTALVLSWLRRLPYLAVGWFWFLGTLVPVIGIVQSGGQARADRFMYLPLIGLSIMTAWGAAELAGTNRFKRVVVAVAGVSAVAAMAACAWLQVGYWKNTTTLFERSAAVIEDNYLAHFQLGMICADQGRFAEARAHYLESIEIAPWMVAAHLKLGELLAAEGESERAIESFERAVEVAPGLPDPQTLLRRARMGAPMLIDD